MEDPITAFVEQSRQQLVDFAQGSQQSNDDPGAAQRHFVASFTRTIDDFVDSLHDREIGNQTANCSSLALRCGKGLRASSNHRQPPSRSGNSGAKTR